MSRFLLHQVYVWMHENNVNVSFAWGSFPPHSLASENFAAPGQTLPHYDAMRHCSGTFFNEMQYMKLLM